MEPTKAYLIEIPQVTNTGVLNRHSLRCYEVNVIPSSSWRGVDISSTGVIYTYSNDKLTKKPTSANLSLKNKWIGNVSVRSSIGTACYGNVLYTSPELAIAAKLYFIHSAKNQQLIDTKAALDRLSSYDKYSDMLTPFMDKNPELFI